MSLGPARFVLLLAAVVLSGGERSRAERQRGRAPADDQQEHLAVGGVDRTYFLHLPRSLAEHSSAPLVLVFHGGGGHASTMPGFTRFDELADRDGFLVAYPESFNKSWNDTRGLSPANDVDFIRTLITKLERSHHADPKRIYATGISNGGFFSNRLACDLSDTLAAIASMAATMPQTLLPVCRPRAPISVMFMHGTKDPVVHIDGGPVLRDRGVAVSLSEGQYFWCKWDGTTSTPVVGALPDHARDGTSVRRDVYGGGKQGTEVIVYTIDGGGHTWPGGPQYLPVFLVGKASHNLDATETIWGFFKKHIR